MNVLRWSLPTGPNPVYRDWDPHLELPSTFTAVELGLVDGPVLDDFDYISDYSGPSSEHPGSRRYCNLADALEPATLVTWRGRLIDLLESLLAKGESWYLFVGGELDPDADTPDEIFVGHIHADHLSLNGAFAIVEVPAGDLDVHATLLGNFDAFSGLIAPAGSLREVLARLTLVDAIPTGLRYRSSSPFDVRDTAALVRVLTHGRLFVEETDNGTRLRFVVPTTTLADLRERLGDLVPGA
jgi:hypothetical protein